MSDSVFLADEIPAQCEEIIRRFEEAWRGPSRPAIESFLPTPWPGHTRLLVELVHIELDFRLRNGESALVEHYLERFPLLERDRDALLSLIAAEYTLRHRWQGGAETEEYGQRFPQYGHDLQDRLGAGSDAVSFGGHPPRPTVAVPAVWPSVPGYRILRELGRGGMGVVYEARQTVLDRVVALKTLLPGYAVPEELDRFRREAEAIARLDHAHIVPVYEVGESGGVPYFSMKYYAGGSLAQRPRARATDLHADAGLVETVARAVHHAHQRGILHRDLKPSNILLDETGNPHVADFGLAKRFDPNAGGTLASTIVGTPSYIAPEQARGERVVTTASDIYGLGAILYELLTGEPPFQGESALATLLAVVDRPPRSPRLANPRVPHDLETICLKCLEKEPARRYASAAELADDLERWRRGDPISARPEGRVESLVRWCRRKPREAAIAVLVVSVLVLAVGGAWWLDRRQAEHRADLTRRDEVRQAEQALNRQQARERVLGALAQMPSLRKQFLWDEAAAVLARSRQEVDAFGLEEQRAVVQQAQRELSLAARLDEILLDRVTMSDEEGAGRAAAARAYREAFRDYGLDLESGDETELVRQVRESPSREELVAALNFCVWVERRDRPRLKAVARAAEPDAWKALLAGIPPGLEMAELQARLKARVAEIDESRLTPVLMARVGRLLEKTDAGLDLLRAAQRRAPTDFWINLTLGNTLCRQGRTDEAIGYLRVALAVRPHRGVVYHNLGIALRQAGRLDESRACHREAARLEPNKPQFAVGDSEEG
ncbi:MAG TPA: protein kinase [Fimbriiglobus sp.]|nr:protein kinase [Fimbriiglobus sp.]